MPNNATIVSYSSTKAGLRLSQPGMNRFLLIPWAELADLKKGIAVQEALAAAAGMTPATPAPPPAGPPAPPAGPSSPSTPVP